jgi:hypothetical protein
MALTEVPPEEPSDPAPPAPPANNSKAAWIVAGVATAVALVAAMVAVSAVMRDHNSSPNTLNAGFQNGFNRPVGGTIQSINGSSFTVKETTFNGQTATTQVATTDKTTFRQIVTGKLTDLKVGDTVTIAGTTADNVFTATRINEANGQANVVRNGPAQAGGATGGGPQFFRNGGGDMRIGKITSIAGDTVTLAALDGTTVTAKTTATTVVRVTKNITMKSLKVGDQVRVFGTMNGSKVTADEVTKGANDAVAP